MGDELKGKLVGEFEKSWGQKRGELLKVAGEKAKDFVKGHVEKKISDGHKRLWEKVERAVKSVRKRVRGEMGEEMERVGKESRKGFERKIQG